MAGAEAVNINVTSSGETTSSLIEKLGAAFTELEAQKVASTCDVGWNDVQEHLSHLESMVKKKLEELEAKKKTFTERESNNRELIAAREAEVLVMERDMLDEAQELKDAAVAAIEEAKETHMAETKEARETHMAETEEARETHMAETEEARETHMAETEEARETHMAETEEARETHMAETEEARETHMAETMELANGGDTDGNQVNNSNENENAALGAQEGKSPSPKQV